VAHDNHPIVLLGQLIYGFLNQGFALILHDMPIRTVGHVRQLIFDFAILRLDGLVDRHGLQLLLAQEVDGMVGRNLVEPRREGIVRGVGLQGIECLDEALLDQIIHLTLLAHHALDVPGQRTAILRHEFAVRGLVSLQGTRNQRAILLARLGWCIVPRAGGHPSMKMVGRMAWKQDSQHKGERRCPKSWRDR